MKINILKTIQQSEMENLKGKQLDNEIKALVKDREILELKFKKRQYNSLCLQNSLDN